MLTLIGLGPGDPDQLTRGAEQALRAAAAEMVAGTGRLFLRTARHPCVEMLDAWGLTYETFDALYDAAPDFAAVYAEIARRVLEANETKARGNVAYAVPGHPLIGEDSTGRILTAARERGLETRVVAGSSFVEAVLTAAGAGLADGFDVRDALTLPLSDTVDRN